MTLLALPKGVTLSGRPCIKYQIEMLWIKGPLGCVFGRGCLSVDLCEEAEDGRDVVGEELVPRQLLQRPLDARQADLQKRIVFIQLAWIDWYTSYRI